MSRKIRKVREAEREINRKSEDWKSERKNLKKLNIHPGLSDLSNFRTNKKRYETELKHTAPKHLDK